MDPTGNHTTKAKAKDILPTVMSVLQVTSFVLERLPFVFGEGKEVVLLHRLLRLLLIGCQRIHHRHVSKWQQRVFIISLPLHTPSLHPGLSWTMLLFCS